MIYEIIADDGRHLDAKCEVGFDQEKQGLILHSRGQKNNTEYNSALEVLLKRVDKLGFCSLEIFIVSRNLLNTMSQKDREILIDGKPINFSGINMFELRKKVGSQQAKMKADELSKDGNPTKRILLYNSKISEELWQKIITNKIKG
jgi:hypothetical protein